LFKYNIRYKNRWRRLRRQHGRRSLLAPARRVGSHYISSSDVSEYSDLTLLLNFKMNKEVETKWLYFFKHSPYISLLPPRNAGEPPSPISSMVPSDAKRLMVEPTVPPTWPPDHVGKNKDVGRISLKSDVWLITGITGQDGSLFADYLLKLGYNNIHGIIRKSATLNTTNIDHIFDKLFLHYGDLTDSINIYNIIKEVQPKYIVNFAAQSHVKTSHSLENYTFHVNTIGVLNILQSVKSLGLITSCKIYHASTSEMYGNQTDGRVLLNESSLMNPVSIYGISKKAAQDICNMYRDAYNMFIVSSILFNHESPRRGYAFVTKKIANYVAMYYHTYNNTFDGVVTGGGTNRREAPVGAAEGGTGSLTAEINSKSNISPKTLAPLQLGNLNAKRDWGDAREYVKSIYLMLMNEKPQNYVIATGETHSVREFVELAFQCINVKITWSGVGDKEVGVASQGPPSVAADVCREEPGTDMTARLINNCKNRILVQVNPKYYRDIDIDCLIGDSSFAKQEIGWVYSLEFKDLVNDMVMDAIQKHKHLYR